MKIYISIPITGRDIAEVAEVLEFYKGYITGFGHTPVSPLDIDHTDPEDYPAVIGTDITALLASDAVIFLSGWHNSKGCRLEHAAATIYGKKKYYHISQLPKINSTRL